MGGVAAACGGKTTSQSGGTASLSGGTASFSGGTATGGTGNPTGGTANASGGSATGGINNPTGGAATGGTDSGGTNSGGTSSGGNATGGTRNALCDVVPSLPAMGTACRTAGESQCDASGNRCICERGIWHCNHACPVTQPTPSTGCEPATFCSYAPGVTCACLKPSPPEYPPDPDSGPPPDPPPRWICIGTSSCPAADLPMTGQDCTGLTDVACDYPNTNPALHFACMCSAIGDAGWTWICFSSAPCPATQPPYGLNQICTGPAVCTYSTPPYHCGCAVPSGQGVWFCV